MIKHALIGKDENQFILDLKGINKNLLSENFSVIVTLHKVKPT